MPELPDVEAVRRTLRPLVRGKRIRCINGFHPIDTPPQSPRQFAGRGEGRRMEGVRRHGKYLFLELDRGLIEMHFRLDGQLTWFSSTRELLERANSAEDGVHVDVAFGLSKGVLGFADGRPFGRLRAWDSESKCKPRQQLGVDAMSLEFTARRLEAEL